MSCHYCRNPHPTELIPVITPDGSHYGCGLCGVRLLADRRVKVTLVVEPAALPVR